MRNDPPGTTPLRKLIAPPERTVQIVSVISNHGDVQPLLVLSLRGLRSLFPLSFLPSPFPPLLPPDTKRFFALPFVLPSRENTRVDQCLPIFLHARFSYGWSPSRKRILTRDPPRRIMCKRDFYRCWLLTCINLKYAPRICLNLPVIFRCCC